MTFTKHWEKYFKTIFFVKRRMIFKIFRFMSHTYQLSECFVENQNRINGFKLYGTAENGSVLSIYNDTSPTPNRNEIFIDYSHMLDVPIKVITIKGPNTGQRILTLCEVFVYGMLNDFSD